jgi:hypothetical protein
VKCRCCQAIYAPEDAVCPACQRPPHAGNAKGLYDKPTQRSPVIFAALLVGSVGLGLFKAATPAWSTPRGGTSGTLIAGAIATTIVCAAFGAWLGTAWTVFQTSK